jgi:hypothetical protein
MPRANYKEVLLYFIKLRMHVGGSKVKGLMALMSCHVFSFLVNIDGTLLVHIFPLQKMMVKQ